MSIEETTGSPSRKWLKKTLKTALKSGSPSKAPTNGQPYSWSSILRHGAQVRLSLVWIGGPPRGAHPGIATSQQTRWHSSTLHVPCVSAGPSPTIIITWTVLASHSVFPPLSFVLQSCAQLQVIHVILACLLTLVLKICLSHNSTYNTLS